MPRQLLAGHYVLRFAAMAMRVEIRTGHESEVLLTVKDIPFVKGWLQSFPGFHS